MNSLKIGHDVLHGGHSIYSLYSSMFNSVAYRELWEIIPDLSIEEAQAIRKRIEAIYASRVRFEEFLRTDKYFVQKSFVEQLHRDQARNDTSLPRRLEIFALNIFMPRRKVFQNYTEYADALIAQAQKPYATGSSHSPVPSGALTRIYAPVYQRTRWNYARVETKTVFLITALALHAYKLEHKRYPEKLVELTPRYLSTVPADPYGRGEALRYRLSGSSYRLYSISADGIDDKGRPTQAASKLNPKIQTYILNPDSKGDFVAGINR